MTCKHKLVADVTVLGESATVLVRYRDPEKYDGEPGWFVPDDYLQRLEHPEAAGKRILREQIGLETDDVALDHVESFEGDGFWHLVFHLGAIIPSATPLKAGPEVAAARWFALDDLPPVDEVAHEGWGLDTVRRVTAGGGGAG